MAKPILPSPEKVPSTGKALRRLGAACAVLPDNGWKEGMVAQRNGGRERLLMYGETNTPIYKRIMTPEDGMRPQLINLYSCNGSREDVTLVELSFHG